MKARKIFAGCAAVALLVARSAWWASSRARHGGSVVPPPIAKGTIAPIAPQQADPQSSIEEPSAHLSWATARPDAIALIHPAPLWSTADLRDMLPPSIGPWLAEFDKRTRRSGVEVVSESALIEVSKLLDTAPAILNVLSLDDTLSLWSGGDLSREAAVGRLGLTVVDRTRAGQTLGNADAARAIEALKRLPEATWWDARDANSLECLFRLRLAWVNPHEEAHDWAQIGLSEALYLKRHYAEALAINDALLTAKSLTRIQSVAVQYNRGLFLSASGRPSDAVGPLRLAAADPTVHDAKEAGQLLVAALARSGQTDEANRALDRWIIDHHPPVQDVANLIELIQLQSK